MNAQTVILTFGHVCVCTYVMPPAEQDCVTMQCSTITLGTLTYRYDSGHHGHPKCWLQMWVLYTDGRIE